MRVLPTAVACALPIATLLLMSSAAVACGRDVAPEPPQAVAAHRSPAPAPHSEPAARAEGSSDRDGDSIPDADDLCPNDAEVFNGRDDDDGCPDRAVDYFVPVAPTHAPP